MKTAHKPAAQHRLYSCSIQMCEMPRRSSTKDRIRHVYCELGVTRSVCNKCRYSCMCESGGNSDLKKLKQRQKYSTTDVCNTQLVRHWEEKKQNVKNLFMLPRLLSNPKWHMALSLTKRMGPEIQTAGLVFHPACENEQQIWECTKEREKQRETGVAMRVGNRKEKGQI